MSATFSSITKQVNLYCATTILVVGIIGDLLNILVFLSLKTFRQSSCAFYLTILSIVNIIVLFVGLFHRIFSAISGIDPTAASLAYCKSRIYLSQTLVGISMTCWCLATIDQYFATCSRPHWQRFCNIKLARRLVIVSSVIWILQAIPLPVFFELVLSSTTHKISCINTNYIHEQYRIYFILLGAYGYIPITITGLFGLMAFYNVRKMARRAVPLVRRELDKQLTVMVLIQVVISIFTLLPYTTVTAVATSGNLTNDAVIQEKLQFAMTVTVMFFYVNFASPFYIYICSSERFRKQLIYVLFKIHFNRWRHPRIDINQVVPET